MTYCKRGYFRWGKISQKCWQDLSHGSNFHDTTHIFFIKSYTCRFYFCPQEIFAEKSISRKLSQRENSHVYSILSEHGYLVNESVLAGLHFSKLRQSQVHFVVQWNLSKPILIRTKEKYRFRHVIGLDRLTFTALDNIILKNWNTYTPHIINYKNNYIVYGCLDIYSIGYI